MKTPIRSIAESIIGSFLNLISIMPIESYLMNIITFHNLQNTIRKLESRIMELENDLDSEARRSADVIKTARKGEKKVKELQFAVEDEKKTAERAQDTAEKLSLIHI